MKTTGGLAWPCGAPSRTLAARCSAVAEACCVGHRPPYSRPPLRARLADGPGRHSPRRAPPPAMCSCIRCGTPPAALFFCARSSSRAQHPRLSRAGLLLFRQDEDVRLLPDSLLLRIQCAAPACELVLRARRGRRRRPRRAQVRARARRAAVAPRAERRTEPARRTEATFSHPRAKHARVLTHTRKTERAASHKRVNQRACCASDSGQAQSLVLWRKRLQGWRTRARLSRTRPVPRAWPSPGHGRGLPREPQGAGRAARRAGRG